MNIKIGKIINTHGIKGELKIKPLTDDMNRYKELDYIYLEGSKYDVISVKFVKNHPVIKLSCIDSIDMANQFRNKYISILKEDLKELDEDSFYKFDLIDLKVYDKRGIYIGKVKEILEYSANDVMVISNKKEYMVPMVKRFIVEVNLKNNKIIIDPIEGMIE